MREKDNRFLNEQTCKIHLGKVSIQLQLKNNFFATHHDTNRFTRFSYIARNTYL